MKCKFQLDNQILTTADFFVKSPIKTGIWSWLLSWSVISLLRGSIIIEQFVSEGLLYSRWKL